jgi:hypothetical protein
MKVKGMVPITVVLVVRKRCPQTLAHHDVLLIFLLVQKRLPQTLAHLAILLVAIHLVQKRLHVKQKK